MRRSLCTGADGPPPALTLADPASPTLVSATAGECVSQILSGFPRNGMLYTLTLGQFDKSDWIEGMARIAGPDCLLTVATWTVNADYVDRLHRCSARVRWLVDKTLPKRDPRAIAAILEGSSRDDILAFPNHAKFACAHGNGWYLVAVMSSNLNLNRRCELYTLHDSPDTYRMFDQYWLDVRRWGGSIDVNDAEYRGLARAKTEAVAKRAEQMGIPTMESLARSVPPFQP